jgi:hypothetical protein
LPKSTPSSDRVAPRAGRGERGVVLVLTLFVILILLVIVPQFRYSAVVDRELAHNEVQNVQMEGLARAAIMRGEAALLVDLDEDRSGGDELGGAAGGAGAGAGGGALGGAGGTAGRDSSTTTTGSGSDGGTGGANAPHPDSLDEVWADQELTLPLGEEQGFKTRIVVVDEDSKLNLLLLFTQDDDYRTEWRERFERMLDLMRDGEPGDLSSGDAGELLSRIEKWTQGDRSDETLSTAPLATGDWHEMLDRAVHAPLSLGELCLAGGIRPQLLFGFEVGDGRDDRRWIPGLEQSLTVWSNLEYVEPAAADASTTPADVKPNTTARKEAPGMNNGRINVNTAPAWVLKSLFPDNEVPYSAWDQYVEFRAKRLEELKEEREELANASDREKESKREEIQPDDPNYPLETIDDLRKLEGFSPDSSSITPEVWTKLSSYITVESNVFTIYAIVGTRDAPRRHYVARAVVWRRTQGDAARCIPIVPFERLSTGSVDMIEFSKELDEWSDAEGYSSY